MLCYDSLFDNMVAIIVPYGAGPTPTVHFAQDYFKNAPGIVSVKYQENKKKNMKKENNSPHSKKKREKNLALPFRWLLVNKVVKSRFYCVLVSVLVYRRRANQYRCQSLSIFVPMVMVHLIGRIGCTPVLPV